jgi:hypothetical protein
MCLGGCEMVTPKPHDAMHPYAKKMVGCGHGVLFSDYCPDCEIVDLQRQYRECVRRVQYIRDRMRVLGHHIHGQTSLAAAQSKGVDK